MSAQLETIVDRWLTSFQEDVRTFLRVVYDDQDLDESIRLQAAGAIVYALAPGDVIPDSMGPLGYVDDALALRIVVEETRLKAPDRFAAYRTRMPEITDPLQEDIEVSKAWLGDTYEPFRVRVLAADKLQYKGKTVPEALGEPQWLEDELSVAAVKMDFKPADVRAAIAKLNTVPGIFRSKLVPRK